MKIFAYDAPAEVSVDYLIINFLGVLSFLLLGAQSDVNTVCFADETGHLVYSGSDDTFCKVQIPFNFKDTSLFLPKIDHFSLEGSSRVFFPLFNSFPTFFLFA